MDSPLSDLRRRRRALLARLEMVRRALRDWDTRELGEKSPPGGAQAGRPSLTRGSLRELHAELSHELREVERALAAEHRHRPERAD